MLKRASKLYRIADIRKISKEVRPTEHQLKSVMEWAKLLESGKLADETKNYHNFSQHIMKGILGYESVSHEEDNVDFTANDPDGNPAMVVECKGTTTDLDKRQPRKPGHSTPMKQLWDYISNTDVQWGMCTNYRFFRLVKRAEPITKYHEIDFKSMYDEDGADTDKVAEFIAVFRNIVLGGDESVGAGGEVADKEITDALYGLYRDARVMMAKEFESRDVPRTKAVDAAQVFLNRIIFLFFAESRDLVSSGLFEKQLEQLDNRFPSENTDVVCTGVQKDLFRALNDGYRPYNIPRFNGGLFKDDIGDNSITFSDYRPQEWFKGAAKPRAYASKRVKNLLAKHPDLSPIICNLVEMHDYDFNTAIDVNILGHVFEQSIQELDDLRADGTSTRKAEGIYYTPSYVVDFICRHAILPYLSASGKYESPNELVMEYAASGDLPVLERKLRDIRVLDPACGSGAFLTGAASLLLEIYGEIHDTKVLKRAFMTKSGMIALDEWSEEAAMRRIVRDNIYGVDKDVQAVKIAQLAMFLLTASSNEPLPDTSDHIIVGNSIIANTDVSPIAVEWSERFKSVFDMDDPGFDIVLGNPPYKKILYLENEKEYYSKRFVSAYGSYDILVLFFELGLLLLKNGGSLGLIVSNKFLISDYGKKIRKILLDQAQINTVIDLSDAKRVFSEASVSPTIILLNKKTPIKNYTIRRLIATKSTTSFSDELFDHVSINNFVSFNGTFNVRYTQEKESIYQKIQLMKKFGDEDMFDVRTGVMGFEYWGMSASMKDGKTSERDIRIATNSYVDQYQFLWGKKVNIYKKTFTEPFVDLNNMPINSNTKMLFLKSNKIIVRGVAKRLTAVLDEEGTGLLVAVHAVLTNKCYEAKFILALLNSRFYNWIHRDRLYLGRIPEGSFRYPISFLKSLPAPEISLDDQLPFIEKSNDIITELEKIEKQSREFSKTISTKFSIQKIPNVLNDVFEYDFSKFKTYMEKTLTRKLSSSELNYLNNYFTKNKNEILVTQNTIRRTKADLDSMVYALFDLNAQEVSLIEMEEKQS